MTIVHIDIEQFADGPNVQAAGSILATASRALIGAGEFVLPAQIYVSYNEAPIDVELAELPAGYAWFIRIEAAGVVLHRCVRPTGAGPVDLADEEALPNLDPTTLDPANDPIAAWVADLAEEAFWRDNGDDTLTTALTTEIAVRQSQDDRLSALPSHAPDNSLLLYTYDPTFNAYNFKPSNTRKLRRGLARARTGQFCEIVVVGDSLPAGNINLVGPVYDRLRSWPMQMRDQLALLGIPTAGTGLVRFNDNALRDARWTSTGTWTNSKLTYSYTAVNGATATFTTNLAGDRVTVGYYDDGTGATFTVHINGVSQGTVTMSGAAGWKSVTFNAAIAAAQTVLITKTSGAFIYIRGACVWNSTGGLLVHNVAQSGSKAYGNVSTPDDNWDDAAALHSLGQVFAAPTVSLTDPDCVIIALGANDKDNDTSDANVTAALTTVRNRWPNSDAILVATTPKAPSYIPDAEWSTYVASLYTLADTLNVPLIDHYARLGNWTTILANGLDGDSAGHLKVEAYADEGRNLGQLFAS